MGGPNNKRRQFFANSMHREMFFLVFFSMIVPTAFTAVCLFYLIFSITAEQGGIPEVIASIIIPAAQKVIAILFTATPVVMLAILFFAHKVTHRIVGPFDRIVRELDANINGTRKGPIKLRPHDKFQPLVDRINKFL